MDSLSGYVHNVSPTKASKKSNSYFNFHIQTGENEYRRAVCFEPKMHRNVQSFEESKTPIKLKNQRQKTNGNDDGDIYIGKRFDLVRFIFTSSTSYRYNLLTML